MALDKSRILLPKISKLSRNLLYINKNTDCQPLYGFSILFKIETFILTGRALVSNLSSKLTRVIESVFRQILHLSAVKGLGNQRQAIMDFGLGYGRIGKPVKIGWWRVPCKERSAGFDQHALAA